jgi:hypothetical protein
MCDKIPVAGEIIPCGAVLRGFASECRLKRFTAAIDVLAQRLVEQRLIVAAPSFVNQLRMSSSMRMVTRVLPVETGMTGPRLPLLKLN